MVKWSNVFPETSIVSEAIILTENKLTKVELNTEKYQELTEPIQINHQMA